MAKPLLPLAGAAFAFVLGVSTAHAAFTTPSCLAKKRVAHGKLQQCRAAADAKILQGKIADLAKCSTKLQEQLAKLNAKASKAGIGCRYRDNGDGTVSDYDTELQWEQKNTAGPSNPHDVDNAYVWSTGAGGTAQTGPLFTSFLSQLNDCSFAPGFFGSAGFAGHCDWRLPALAELQSIVGPCVGGSCIDPIFGSTATEFAHWSSTSSAASATSAWSVHFGDGTAEEKLKTGGFFARAVRTGL